MRTSTAIVAAVAVLFVLTWFAFPEYWPNAAAQVRSEIPNAAKAEAQKWEYKTITTNLDAEVNSDSKTLNALGADGWELCATAWTERGGPYCILKRSVRAGSSGVGAVKRLD